MNLPGCLLPFFPLLVLVLAVGVPAEASPPPPGSEHFANYEQGRRDYPRPAGKPVADLDVGESRTVRVIYFLPNDRPYRADVVDTIKVRMRQVQTFYAEQMQAHGYGNTTFRLETDGQGEPRVHRVDGQYSDDYYLDDTSSATREIRQFFALDENIYLVVVDNSIGALGIGDGRISGGFGSGYKKSGLAMVPAKLRLRFSLVAHELGHAFGLQHDFRDDAYIMSYGDGRQGLSACAAEFLSVHPYFNSASSLDSGPERPTAELISPPAYAAGTAVVPIQLRVADPEGLHQVILFGVTATLFYASGFPEVKSCHMLSGEKEALIEFEYDGSIPSWPEKSLSDPVSHPLSVEVINSDGDVGTQRFVLAEMSPYLSATLNGPTDINFGVQFSPDGSRLASASAERILLWDVETRKQIALFEDIAGRGAGDRITAISFSPDGARLAIGTWYGRTLLWDVETGEQTAFPKVDVPWIDALSFSPDGAILAAGGAGRIILWDVEAREPIRVLEDPSGDEALLSQIFSMAFSPDGALLATGSWEGIVVWDMETREPIATLEGYVNVGAVKFSPDSSILAYGSRERFYLWDVETRSRTGIFRGHEGIIASLAFSPDGGTLASTAFDSKVILWDFLTKKPLATFAHTSSLRSASFSPDGNWLAAGGTKTFVWDVSTWKQPRLFALRIISGDGQQAPPGQQLGRPLVVEAQDQYGDPLPDEDLIFTVTAGEGKLSERFTVEHAMTDATGRVELTFTLGREPGPNVVEVMWGGREMFSFFAEGVGGSVAELEGNYRTWHLPEGAVGRLGKGVLGTSDRAVAVSPDGRCLAVASGIGTWLYETDGSSSIQALLPSALPVHSVAFSPHGLLAAGLTDRAQIELWDVETGQRVGTFQHGPWGRVVVAFAPDGTSLASGVSNGDQPDIRLWNVETQEQTAVFRGHTDDVRSMAFSPDGSRLASASRDETVRLWDVAAETEIATYEHENVTAVAFSPDGSRLASGGWDRRAILWDVETEKQVASFDNPDHAGGVPSVAFSPDGALLASANFGAVRMWDLATHTQGVVWGERYRKEIHSVAFSPDGTLVYGAVDGWVWAVENGGLRAAVQGHASLFSMALSRDGALLATGGQSGMVTLWDVATRTPMANLEGYGEHEEVHAVAFSPDRVLLAGGAWTGVNLWEVETRRLRWNTAGGTRSTVRGVAFAGNGAFLASVRDDEEAVVRVWEVGAGEPVEVFSGHVGSVRSLAASPDGTLLASGGGNQDKTIKLWDVEARTHLGDFLGHPRGDFITSLSFSPDGRLLASTGGRDREIKLWDAKRVRHRATLKGSSDSHSASFSPDGAILLSGWADGSVRLWDMTTGEPIGRPLKGHTAPVRSVVWNDSLIVSGSEDGTMLLWDKQRILLRPQTLTKLSGDKQQGMPSATLAEPFAVSVLDQNGDPLAGATVVFAVTAGGGTLSASTAISDENGRAATTLTLGSDPGRNTVTAKVAELKAVIFSATAQATPTSLSKVSGDKQEGAAGAALAEPFRVQVLDQNGDPLAGATVAFAVTAGGGTLSASTAISDENGRAATTLTLGSDPETVTVAATVAELEPVTFTATAKSPADFDGDGETGFSDFFLFADAFGGTDARFDLDGSGSVDFADFFLLADHFADLEARGKLLALAREMIGLPDGPQLQQNVPNPFNSQTVISWFQLSPGMTRLEAFSLTGQRVAVLHQGHKNAGVHRVHWDGRDDGGRPLASGVYLYRLTTDKAVHTRKLTLLR